MMTMGVSAVLLVLAQLGREGEAIHVRHLHVGQDGIELGCASALRRPSTPSSASVTS